MRAQQIDDSSEEAPSASGTAGVWAPHERFTTKQRSAAHREVERILDDLAPQRPPPRGGDPEAAVKLYRSPGRCVMQAASGAVSVSWFPGQGADETLGEMQVIEWRGVVSLLGSARRASGGAAALETSLFHPVELGTGGWEWQTADGQRTLTTDGLIRHCRDLLERRHDAGAVAVG